MAEIKWFGHGCFRLRGREATILMDRSGARPATPAAAKGRYRDD
jgi:L-ascorbate metabolism protein UlaG (beta-lactamase superfamily)